MNAVELNGGWYLVNAAFPAHVSSYSTISRADFRSAYFNVVPIRQMRHVSILGAFWSGRSENLI